jgi:hypothetical protein
MKFEVLEKYPGGIITGFLVGLVIIHPFSMVFEGMLLPVININFQSLIHAFQFQHLPMALFFGLLGLVLGAINVHYLKLNSTKLQRIKLLEGLLPICSYCNKVRDDNGKVHGEGQWEKVDTYIYRKTNQEFTHGICPDCVDTVFSDKNKKTSEKLYVEV